MNCPYCSNEMELGLIQSAQELAWTKGETKRAFRIAGTTKDAVILSPLNLKNMATGCAVKAHLCRSCRKIVIDCEYFLFESRCVCRYNKGNAKTIIASVI